ncbi:MAG: CinA family protein [Rhodospirillales bacterium]|nr:CinA family protein [Rhodospirillales bacterium]
MVDDDLIRAANRLFEACRVAGNARVATAESCTGGLISAALTAVPGSSQWFERGFVTYSNAAKTDLLGVPAPLIAKHGAVSEEVAQAMAKGVLAHAPVMAGVAVSGIAGPDGGTPDKPVGLVHIAAARRNGHSVHERHIFPGDRHQVRKAAALTAMALLTRLIGEKP